MKKLADNYVFLIVDIDHPQVNMHLTHIMFN